MGKNNLLLRILAGLMAVAMTASFMAGCAKDDDVPLYESSEVSEDSSQAESFPAGTEAAGVDISGMTVSEAAIAVEKHIKNDIKSIRIAVSFGDKTLTVNGSNIVIKTSDLEAALRDLLLKGKPLPKELAVVSLDEYVVNQLMYWSENESIEAKDAKLLGYDAEKDKLEIEEHVNGKVLDVEKTTEAILALLTAGESGKVEAVFTETEAKVTAEYLQENFKLLGEYSTISTNTANGNHNMALALSRCNGLIMEPGDVFSFNGTVGDSTTAASGFKAANGIMNGLLVPMYGGGICQASTTIYGAILRAGLEVVQRDEHSMPSSYCPIGLDATVSYNDLDFKFKNNLENPIYLYGEMFGNELVVKVFGIRPDEYDEVQITSWVTETIDAPKSERYVVDNKLDKGDVELRQSAGKGYRASAMRKFLKDGVEVRSEYLPDSYYGPVTKTFAVGPGTDTDELKDGKPKATPTPKPTPEPEDDEPETDEPETDEPEPTAKPTAKPTPTPPQEPTDETDEGEGNGNGSGDGNGSGGGQVNPGGGETEGDGTEATGQDQE